MSGHNASLATRCLVCETRAAPSLTGSLRTVRMQSRARLRAAVAREAFAAARLEAAPRALEGAVAPFHRRLAARAGVDRGLGSRRGGRRCGHPETIGRAEDVGSRGGCPVTPSGHPPARAPALRAARFPRWPGPTAGSCATLALVPGAARREPRCARVSPFAYRSRGDERIRTAVRGFAGLCLTTRPRRPAEAS